MTMSLRTLAIIPARGGSKGLPGKNIRSLAGLPLIAHAIKAARLVPFVSRCIVTTDSKEIAAVARSYGADVPFLRPAALATEGSGNPNECGALRLLCGAQPSGEHPTTLSTIH